MTFGKLSGKDEAPFDSRAIGDLEIIMSRKLKETWSLGYCPLCWWRSASEFHETADPKATEKRLIQSHRTEKPDCHEKLKFIHTEKHEK
jgi:hypothetical protein